MGRLQADGAQQGVEPFVAGKGRPGGDILVQFGARLLDWLQAFDQEWTGAPPTWNSGS